MLLIIAELVSVCACCAVLGVLATTGNWLSAPVDQSADVASTPTATLAVIPTRLPTRTPAPTNTRVLPLPPANVTTGPLSVVTWTPTREPVSYDIVVPTPTAPPLNYPITFASNLGIATYPVSGQTLNDLVNSLNAQAMPDSNDPSGRYYAQTQYYVAAQWFVQPTARGCEVESGSVTLAMTMTLPALSSTAGMPPDVLDHWTTFVNNTITHETGHVRRDQQGARDLQHGLGTYPPAADCATLKSKLSDLFDRASNAIRQSNIDYDAATNHGATQGAVFP